jgi:hypothetical protein
LSSLFDVPAQLALALSLAASAGGGGSSRAHPVFESPAAPTALDIFDLQTVDGPLRFSDALWFRALKESASGPDADDVAGSIFRTSGGRYYVPAAAERRRILQKRMDTALAARIARAFAEHNAEQMQQDLQRAPTAGELYIAHLFGPEVAVRFIGRVEATPNKSAAKEMPELAQVAPTLVFVRGVSLTLEQVYERLTQPFAGIPAVPAMKPTVLEAPRKTSIMLRAPASGWRSDVAAAGPAPAPPTQ